MATKPMSNMGWIRPPYIQHLEEWLEEQGGKSWDASMIASKVGSDIEKQQDDEGKRFNVETILLGAFNVHQVMSDRNDYRLWVDMLPYINLELIELRPSISSEMAKDENAGSQDFMDEFDLLIRDYDLNNNKVVVLFNLPDCKAWPSRWRHQSQATEK